MTLLKDLHHRSTILSHTAAEGDPTEAGRLPPHGYSLNLEARVEEQSAGPEKGPSRKLILEIRPVHRIERVVVRDIGAEDLDRYEVVHGHARRGERVAHIVQDEPRFGFRGGRYLLVGIQPDRPRQIERIAGQNGAGPATSCR